MKDIANSTRRRSLLLAAAATGFILSGCQDVTTGMYGRQAGDARDVAPPKSPPIQRAKSSAADTVRVAMLLPSSVAGNGAVSRPSITMPRCSPWTTRATIRSSSSSRIRAASPSGRRTRPPKRSGRRLDGARPGLFDQRVVGRDRHAAVGQANDRLSSDDRSPATASTCFPSCRARSSADRGYAAGHGYKQMVAILPNGPYGDLALAELKRTLSARAVALCSAWLATTRPISRSGRRPNPSRGGQAGFGHLRARGWHVAGHGRSLAPGRARQARGQEAARHRPVDDIGPQQHHLRGRLVRRCRSLRLRGLQDPLQAGLRHRPDAQRRARLRCGHAGGESGQAIRATGRSQRGARDTRRLPRRDRPLPLPSRRNDGASLAIYGISRARPRS